MGSMCHCLRRVSLKDIAEKTGYSINTVSRALKDKEDIAEATRKLIKETARKMGYISTSFSSSLRSGYTKTIALILGDISNPHFAIITKEIEKNAWKHKYSLLIINTDEDPDIEEQAIYAAISKKVDGIIICPTQKRKSNVEFIQKAGIPFVLIGRYFEDMDTDYVVCDDKKGGYLAIRHLIELGHKRILFLNGPGYISSARERLAGYRKALSEGSIEFDPSLVCEIPITLGNSGKHISKALEKTSGYTAILAFSDLIAWETAYALGKKNIRTPSDISIVGFDDIQSRFYFAIPLTTIRSSKSGMAKRAFDILLRRINQGLEGECIHDVLDVRLVVRSSTKNI